MINQPKGDESKTNGSESQREKAKVIKRKRQGKNKKCKEKKKEKEKKILQIILKKKINNNYGYLQKPANTTSTAWEAWFS